MATPETHTEFEQRWHVARYHDDLGATIDLIIEAYSSGDPPPWLEEEHRRLWGHVASTLDADPDDDDTELGHLALRLSAAREDDYPLALLGLSSIGIQRAEQGFPVDPRIPDLLHSMLELYDAVPEHVHSDYVRRWRELAVARIGSLVRRDQERRMREVRDGYLRATGTVRAAGAGDAGRADIAVVRDGLGVLAEAHRRLSPFAPLLEDPAEQGLLFDDLRACEELMATGRDALRVPTGA